MSLKRLVDPFVQIQKPQINNYDSDQDDIDAEADLLFSNLPIESKGVNAYLTGSTTIGKIITTSSNSVEVKTKKGQIITYTKIK